MSIDEADQIEFKHNVNSIITLVILKTLFFKKSFVMIWDFERLISHFRFTLVQAF